jgi:hypothetical protein
METFNIVEAIKKNQNNKLIQKIKRQLHIEKNKNFITIFHIDF